MKLDKANELLKRDRAVISPSYPRAATFVMELREKVIEEAFDRELPLLGGGESTIRLFPVLGIEERLLDEGLRIIEESISNVST